MKEKKDYILFLFSIINTQLDEEKILS